MFLWGNSMQRYINLIWIFFKNTTMSYLEYRFEFISWSIVSFFWIAMTLISVELIFGSVSSIAGWTKDQVLLVVTVYGIVSSLLWIGVLPSLLHFPEMIQTGYFDFYLLKPVSTRFLVSANKYDLDNFPRVIVLALIAISLIKSMSITVSLLQIIIFILSMLCGIVIFYSLFFIIAVSAIWFVDIFNFEDLLNNTLNVGRLPTDIFKGALKAVFVFIVPVAFVATIPVQFLLGKSNQFILPLGAILAVAFFALSHLFWRYALSKYSSASS